MTAYDRNERKRRAAVKIIRDLLADDDQPTPAVAAFDVAAEVMVAEMSQTPDDLLDGVATLIGRLYGAYLARLGTRNVTVRVLVPD